MKKDLDYIANLEKVISETYGKDSVQDFRSNWVPEKEEDYLEQLKHRTAKHSCKEKQPRVKKQDRSCPVCKTYSFSIKDDLYMNRFKCCYNCYVDFAKSRPKKWSDGWRPSDEDVKKFLLLRRKNNG